MDIYVLTVTRRTKGARDLATELTDAVFSSAKLDYLRVVQRV